MHKNNFNVLVKKLHCVKIKWLKQGYCTDRYNK